MKAGISPSIITERSPVPITIDGNSFDSLLCTIQFKTPPDYSNH